MNKVVAPTVPWLEVADIIKKLFRYSHGGIDKQEAAELAGDLVVLAAHIIESGKK